MLLKALFKEINAKYKHNLVYKVQEKPYNQILYFSNKDRLLISLGKDK